MGDAVTLLVAVALTLDVGVGSIDPVSLGVLICVLLGLPVTGGVAEAVCVGGGVPLGVMLLVGVLLGVALELAVLLGVMVEVGLGVALTVGQFVAAAMGPAAPGKAKLLMSPEPSSQKNRHRCAVVRPPAGTGADTMLLEGGVMVHTLPIW